MNINWNQNCALITVITISILTFTPSSVHGQGQQGPGLGGFIPGLGGLQGLNLGQLLGGQGGQGGPGLGGLLGGIPGRAGGQQQGLGGLLQNQGLQNQQPGVSPLLSRLRGGWLNLPLNY